jgi:hypothetical protein
VESCELFAVVAHNDPIRLFHALSSIEIGKWTNLEKTMYMKTPEGADIPDSKELLLNKALYGLN